MKAKPEVAIEVDVRFRDCDLMGHVNNAVYLTYFEIARVEFWRRILGGRDPADFSFILAEATVTYRAPARFGDRLRVSIAVDSIGNRSWTFGYRIVDAASGREVAVGRTVQVVYDYAAGRSAPMPADLRRALAGEDGG